MSSQTQAILAPPLNLPNGSVRAAMALIISLTLWIIVLRGGTPAQILVNAATLVVIFYFAVRLTAQHPITPQVLHKHRYLHPSVRLLLFVGFLVIAGYFYAQGRTPPQNLGNIISTLEGYALGFASNLVIHRLHSNKPLPTLRLWHHGKAAVVLAVTGALCLSFLYGLPPWLPSYTQSLLGPTVAFYFGSRPV